MCLLSFQYVQLVMLGEELHGSKTTAWFWNPSLINPSSRSLARHPAIWVLLGLFHKASGPTQ